MLPGENGNGCEAMYDAMEDFISSVPLSLIWSTQISMLVFYQKSTDWISCLACELFMVAMPAKI